MLLVNYDCFTNMCRVSLYYSVNCGDQFNQGDGFDKAMFGDQRFNINVYGKYKSGNFFALRFNTTAYGLRYVGLVICPANQFMPWR